MTGQGQLRLLGVSDVPRPKPIPRGEAGKRDAALDLLQAQRSEIIGVALVIARRIAKRRGRVTSVQVFEQLRADGWGPRMMKLDPRWMGPVFRAGNGWVRDGYENTGSHKRPVAVWRIRE